MIQSGAIDNDAVTWSDDSTICTLDTKEDNDEIDGEVMLEEILDNLNELGLVVKRFGTKMGEILSGTQMQGIMFKNHETLRLTCLGANDIFQNLQTDNLLKTSKKMYGSKPVLFWLYQVVLPMLFPYPADGATLKLDHQSSRGQNIRTPNIDIMVTSRGSIYVELTIHRGGKYRRREIFSGTACERSSTPEDLDHGDDWEHEPQNMSQNAPISLRTEDETSPARSGSLLDVIHFLWSGKSKWREATEHLLQEEPKNKRAFYETLVKSVRAANDRMVVSDAQNEQCIALFSYFPPRAREKLKDEIGKSRYEFSSDALRPCDKD
ncbi:hypothetical protein EIK77_000838 [Talaromyces pinophilus]|nr:hypothetical protein EIK77_000838 [Talaromyces pinophilus]